MKLKLIKKVLEAKHTYSFYFSSNEKLAWIPGQYLYLTIGEITEDFTIASSPTEKLVQITTRIRKESEFKQKLISLEIGSLVEARAPFGSFCYNYSLNPVPYTLFLAGGIGITPFRSMIKYNVDKKLNIPMHLIYSNSDSEFVFKEELDKWQKENDFIKVSYHDSSISGHLDVSQLNILLSNYKVASFAYHFISTTFWVVGPNSFVNSMEDILEGLNVSSNKISTEKFTGY